MPTGHPSADYHDRLVVKAWEIAELRGHLNNGKLVVTAEEYQGILHAADEALAEDERLAEMKNPEG